MQGSNGKVWDQEQDDLLERIHGYVDLKNKKQTLGKRAQNPSGNSLLETRIVHQELDWEADANDNHVGNTRLVPAAL